ncbi:hypothetical protein KSP39_PZI009320 [Platanthera zijinensis]|uniref:Uncharacterized protein n=1 Tax=Platanthera zijinensis TaxID=2320716 RepID=A0AAP0G7B1_9ASPA
MRTPMATIAISAPYSASPSSTTTFCISPPGKVAALVIPMATPLIPVIIYWITRSLSPPIKPRYCSTSDSICSVLES